VHCQNRTDRGLVIKLARAPFASSCYLKGLSSVYACVCYTCRVGVIFVLHFWVFLGYLCLKREVEGPFFVWWKTE
jgi:hypothetical protein